MSTATELRTARDRLRCKHSHPVQPPHGSIFKPGPCEVCGMPWGDRIELAEPLREPLASWLEEYADWAARSIEHNEELDVLVHESEYCDGEIGKNCRCFDRALAVAHAIASPDAAAQSVDAAKGITP